METDQSIDFNNFSHKSFHALQGKVVLAFVETYQASFDSFPLSFKEMRLSMRWFVYLKRTLA